MSASVATKPSYGVILDQLRSMQHQVQTPECRHWLEQELEGYSATSPLPWYRIVPCRQRGHFIELATGKQLTCHIGSQALSQRDLAQVQFIYAREPAAYYLCQHGPELEPWPDELLHAYQDVLIPGHFCLHAWHEPLSSLRLQLLEGLSRFMEEYPRCACTKPLQGFKAMQHRHWHF
ncbi:hypothetical protein [Aeromonas simiae]|uniref:AbiTii domain-containing protein n=1 Tax=Aeromonas simiae TaxID=218936 RepID=UPI0005A929AE|nr:hypothetical protein [Aeromonas simiae]MDO2949519.1 hypothetical protein [Aeromonas simiae]MDO2953183.1 hypothetical protein [Aeromonas simiae]MDO2956880.1 hypothetical protein [Aeromonas simiae]